MSYSGTRKLLLKAGVLREHAYGQPTTELLAEILSRWNNGESQARIGEVIGYSQTKVGRILHENSIPLEERRKGPNSGCWKGGAWKHGQYLRVYVDKSDPFYEMADRAGYVLEHRIVMARSLGRILTSTETVHHIDGNSLNNDLSNLQLRQGRHEKGAHMCCLNCGSTKLGFIPLSNTAD